MTQLQTIQLVPHPSTPGGRALSFDAAGNVVMVVPFIFERRLRRNSGGRTIFTPSKVRAVRIEQRWEGVFMSSIKVAALTRYQPTPLMVVPYGHQSVLDFITRRSKTWRVMVHLARISSSLPPLDKTSSTHLGLRPRPDQALLPSLYLIAILGLLAVMVLLNSLKLKSLIRMP